ncbi:MAG: isochorismatase family protein [Candidatus Woesearchaeota archaeon]
MRTSIQKNNIQETLFWNVDTQYDFMRNDEAYHGKLPVLNAHCIESNLEKITAYATRHAVRVVNTGDLHDKNSTELSDNPDYITTFPPHCIRGTLGAEYVPAVAPKDAYIIDWKDESIDTALLRKSRNIIIYKDAFDAFDSARGNRHTKNIVGELRPETVVIYGVATNYCVRFAVEGFIQYAKREREHDGRAINLYVVKDAIKEIPMNNLQKLLEEWSTRGVQYISTNELIIDATDKPVKQ